MYLRDSLRVLTLKRISSLPRLSYSVFIYVGTLLLYLQPHVQADVDFQANICDDSTILRAHAGVEPFHFYN